MGNCRNLIHIVIQYSLSNRNGMAIYFHHIGVLQQQIVDLKLLLV